MGNEETPVPIERKESSILLIRGQEATLNRASARTREMLDSNADLTRRPDAPERKCDAHFKVVLEATRQVLKAPERPKRSFGFQARDPQYVYSARERNVR